MLESASQLLVPNVQKTTADDRSTKPEDPHNSPEFRALSISSSEKAEIPQPAAVPMIELSVVRHWDSTTLPCRVLGQEFSRRFQ